MIPNLIRLREKEKDHHQRKQIDDLFSYSLRHQTFYQFDRVVKLTLKEKTFLETLIRVNGAIVSYEHFSKMIWDDEEVSDVARRQLVFRLRQKLLVFH